MIQIHLHQWTYSRHSPKRTWPPWKWYLSGLVLHLCLRVWPFLILTWLEIRSTDLWMEFPRPESEYKPRSYQNRVQVRWQTEKSSIKADLISFTFLRLENNNKKQEVEICLHLSQRLTDELYLSRWTITWDSTNQDWSKFDWTCEWDPNNHLFIRIRFGKLHQSHHICSFSCPQELVQDVIFLQLTHLKKEVLPLLFSFYYKMTDHIIILTFRPRFDCIPGGMVRVEVTTCNLISVDLGLWISLICEIRNQDVGVSDSDDRCYSPWSRENLWGLHEESTLWRVKSRWWESVWESSPWVPSPGLRWSSSGTDPAWWEQHPWWWWDGWLILGNRKIWWAGTMKLDKWRNEKCMHPI